VNLYSSLPATGPLTSSLGHALLTLSETSSTDAEAYSRYYEGDHFLPVGMSTAWVLAGRRWEGDPGYTHAGGFTDETARTARRWFFAAYWVASGRLDDAKNWLAAANARTSAERRVFVDRIPILTSFADFIGSRRKQDFPVDSFALMDPTRALTVEVVDDPHDSGPQRLLDRAARVVETVESVSAVLIFRESNTGGGLLRYVLLWFLDADPGDHRPSVGEVSRMADDGFRVQVLATLAPRRMGVGIVE